MTTGKRLILMRHAKSDWSGGVPDLDRPLNKRGRLAASALGDWMRQTGLSPDQVLCSTAMRTRETLARLQIEAPTDFDPGLYLAEPGALMASLRDATGACVLMLGHNSGIAEFAQAILANSVAHPDFDRYPTGATLVARFQVATWAEADYASAMPEHFVIPRELT